MRFIIPLATLCAVLVGLIGCSDSGASASTASDEQASKPELTIGVSIPAADHGWTAGVKWWADQATALYPEVDWIISTAADSSKQIGDIEAMLTKGVDGMVVLATESAPLTPVAEKVAKHGVYLVNVDRGFLKPVADVFIEGDNAAFGRKSAEYMAERLDGKGKIIVLEGIPSTVNTARVEAAQEVFDQYPEIEILDSQSGMWNRQKALEVMQAMLAKHDEIDAIWASDDDMALGAEQALKEAGRAQDVWMLGGAGMKDIVKRVMEGDPMFPADITYPPSMIAMGIHMAVSNLRDGHEDRIEEFMPKHIVLDVELITPENAADYYFPDSVY